MRVKHLTPQFVESFPDKLEPGELYLAMEFGTAVHLCACGCGTRVITPFSPTDWQMSFDGETVSLKPSVGNWTLPCRSHYWVRSGRIEWAGDMSQEEVNAGRKRDAETKARRRVAQPGGQIHQPEPTEHSEIQELSLFGKLRKWSGW
jgi:hypothetical protein